MKGPQSNFLLVYVMALFIILAFLLAFTLVVTAAAHPDPSDSFRLNMAILRDNVGVVGGEIQCLDDELSLHETCPIPFHSSVLFKVVDERL